MRSRQAGGECKNKLGPVFKEPVDGVDIVKIDKCFFNFWQGGGKYLYG